jgi:hypothetical protein
MKILYISNFDLPDFQNDMIFHGARTLFGENCVDYNEAWYMYDDMKQYWNHRVPENGMSYGRGFTLYGRLPKINIDRSNLYEKIKNKFFDIIIYGSIVRCNIFFDIVSSIYNKNNIIIIDGEDDSEIRSYYINKGIYFKRELIHNPTNYLHPINFSIPEELIVNKIPTKEKNYGEVIPGNPSTYIFIDEIPYFKDYQKSYFGLTFKKGGWDCLRHYEILMNGCIPFFPNIEECPPFTMEKFPKNLIIEINKFINNGNLNIDIYNEYCSKCIEHTTKHLTTKSVFLNLLNNCTF